MPSPVIELIRGGGAWLRFRLKRGWSFGKLLQQVATPSKRVDYWRWLRSETA
jgi:hypothetical protein